MGGSGGSIKDQLMSVWRQTGVKPKELDELKELPESCTNAWKVFVELHSTRTSNGFGANPIAWSEIESYNRLFRLELEDWELDLIRRFDRIILKLYQEQSDA